MINYLHFKNNSENCLYLYKLAQHGLVYCFPVQINISFRFSMPSKL